MKGRCDIVDKNSEMLKRRCLSFTITDTMCGVGANVSTAEVTVSHNLTHLNQPLVSAPSSTGAPRPSHHDPKQRPRVPHTYKNKLVLLVPANCGAQLLTHCTPHVLRSGDQSRERVCVCR